MEEMTRYDALTLSPDYRFVRVVSEDGVFYDLIRKWRVREHVFRMKQTYSDAAAVRRAAVPPCICRDFTALEGPGVYRDSVWKNGARKIFPPTPSK